MRLPISPVPHSEPKLVPVEGVVGPFVFPLRFFRTALIFADGCLMDFKPFANNPIEASKSLGHKRLMDVMLFLFKKLFEEENQPLRAAGFFCAMLPRADAASPVDCLASFCENVRAAHELSDAYALAESFAFFFVTEPNDGERVNPVSDAYDCMDVVFEHHMRRNKCEPDPHGHPERVQRHADAVKAALNVISPSYNFTPSSMDFSDCFRCPLDVLRMFEAIGHDVEPASALDTRRLVQSTHTLKHAFGFSRLVDQQRVPHPALRVMLARDAANNSWSLDLARGLCFFVHPNDVSRETFKLSKFPDIRRLTHERLLPNRDLVNAIENLNFDRFVLPENKGVFQVLREHMASSVADIDALCQTLPAREAREKREAWRRSVTTVLKQLFDATGRVSKSFKALVRHWQSHVEAYDRVMVRTLPTMRYGDLDAQQCLLHYFWDLMEDESTYSQHSHGVRMLLNARWSVAKHLASRYKPPHEALMGEPGSGKSRLMEMVQIMLPEEVCLAMSSWSDKGMLTDKDPDTGEINREHNFTDVTIFQDELNLSDFGYADGKAKDKSFGEGNPRTAIAKQFLAPLNRQLTWVRQVRKVDKYGAQTYFTETGVVSMEALVTGNLNGKKGGINPAFFRRVAFVNVNKRTRDDQDFETIKRKEKRSKEMHPTRDAMKDNARLQYTIGLARFVGACREDPPMTTFDLVVKRFETAMLKITDVSHFSERLDDARRRVQLFIDAFACAATLQVRSCERARAAVQSDGRAAYTFDEIMAAQADVEAVAVPGERTCLAVLGTLEDVCLPAIHRYALEALCQTFRDEVRAAFEDDTDASFIDLGVREHPTIRETGVECAVRALSSAIMPYFRTKTNGFDIKNPGFQVEGALEELMELNTGVAPRHAVLKIDQTETEVRVYLSKYRLRKLHAGVHTILEECLHAGSPIGKQLLLAPFRKEVPLPGFEDLGLKTLKFAPHLPMVVDVRAHGAGCPADGGGECACFRRRPAPLENTAAISRRTIRQSASRCAPPRVTTYPGILDDEAFRAWHEGHTFLDPSDALVREKFHPAFVKLRSPDERPEIDRPDVASRTDVGF